MKLFVREIEREVTIYLFIYLFIQVLRLYAAYVTMTDGPFSSRGFSVTLVRMWLIQPHFLAFTPPYPAYPITPHIDFYTLLNKLPFPPYYINLANIYRFR